MIKEMILKTDYQPLESFFYHNISNLKVIHKFQMV